jgi:hypothetical protein
LGVLIVRALDLPLVRQSEYLQILLIDLFSRVPELNHINSLTVRFANASPAVRRELVRAAGAAKQGHWVREVKGEFLAADPWFRRALVSSAPSLAGDEPYHWLRNIRGNMSSMEKLVALWVFNDPNLRLGPIDVVQDP